MACLLKAPTGASKGVVVFTTPERDEVINKDARARAAIEALKSRWVVGLHHNWHDHAFVYDSLFDFSMAGEGDLSEVNERDVPLISLDACNFAPSCFRPGGDKHWDILSVARAVAFKGVEELMKAVRRAYDQEKLYRVLYLCPVSSSANDITEWSAAKLHRDHAELFSAEERKRFTILTMDFDYPFPLDIQTLATFYRASRVFAHFAPNERRVRVAGYAWASGLPVIGAESVASILPAQLQREPYYFDLNALGFVEATERALLASPANNEALTARSVVADAESRVRLRAALADLFARHGLLFTGEHLALEHLDIRLGRHHALSTGSNRLDQDLEGFAKFIGSSSAAELHALSLVADPESEIVMMDLEKT